MGQSKNTPQDNVFVFNVIVSRSSVCNTADFNTALQGISPTSIELIIRILGNPQMMLSK